MTAPPPRPRIALYGHDTQGLGHLRRNLVLASAFASDHPAGLGAEVLLLTGASEVGMFPRPRGVDALVLPGVRKDERGQYTPRQMRGRLADVVRFRSTMIEAALTQFPPDLLVVDKTARGFQGELRRTLRALRAAGTRLVLGLRDVLDDVPTTRAQWRKDLADDAVREFYDEIWVYGDPAIHDLRVATGMAPDVAARTHHLGYLSADRIDSDERQHRPDTGGREYVLVMVGGGQDGAELSRLAAAMTPRPGLELIVLTGPQLAEQQVREVRRVAQHCPRVQVMRFSRHGAAWLTGAAAVITMGGANTVAEILDTDVPALVVPRVAPRAEQLVRAEALAAHGYLSVLRPDELSTARLQQWMHAAVGTRTERRGLNHGGVAATTARARALLGAPPSVRHSDVTLPATVLSLRSPHVA